MHCYRFRARLARWRLPLLGFLIVSVLGSIVGIALIAMGKAGRRTKIPFGTFLAAGAVLSALAGGPVVNWYLGLVH